MRTRLLPVVVLAAATWLVACGPRAGLPGGSATPTPTASASPGIFTEYPGARVLRDPADTLRLRTGDEVVIELSTERNFEPWAGVRSADPNLVAPLYPPVTARPGVTATALVALAAGSVRLEATTTPKCTPPTPLPTGEGWACPALARVWELDVEVAPGSRGAASVLAEAQGEPGFVLHLRAGDSLTLPAGLTDARNSAPDVLAPLGRRADGTQGFRTTAAGTAELTAETDPPCRHARPPCMIATMLYRLTVVVSG